MKGKRSGKKFRKSRLILFVGLILLSVSILVACDRSPAVQVGNAPIYSEAEFRARMEEIKEIELAKDGESGYSIVVDGDVYDEIIDDAVYMQGVLRKMTGNDTAFEICSEVEGKSIILGRTRDENLREKIKDDGYGVSYSDGNIYLFGSAENNAEGTANAVYSFLEDELGCMFVREDWDYIPNLPTIYLAGNSRYSNPDFIWRRIYQYEVSQNDWSRRIKSNGTGEFLSIVKNDFGNDGNKSWGTWCHSSFIFVPPEEYFDEHPEYYSFIAGKRRLEYAGMPGQLCWTNPDIFGVINDNLNKYIAEYPDILYWDISVMDSVHYCSCSDCMASYHKYGSHAGALFEVLNKIAKAHPDKIISTLVYLNYDDVPKGMALEDNINIVIAPLESSQINSAKFGQGRAAKSHKMIADWADVTDNIFVWDYVVNFHNLLMPFPNYSVQKDNLEYYKANNVRRIFHQGSRESGDEQARMRSYVLSKQLWDINLDVEATLSKYITVTMGDAAPYIMEYIDLMLREVEKSAEFDIYDPASAHAAGYLSRKNILKYEELIGKAAKAAEGDARITRYVEEFEINVLYAKMTSTATTLKDKRNAFDRFKILAKEQGIAQPYEAYEPTMVEFINKTYPQFLMEEQGRIAIIVISVTAGLACVALLYFRIKKYMEQKHKKVSG